ncbi:hypothetical protein A9W99_06680 [Mycobacterium sp. 1164966.3]|uniref:hypothetical protein n=1 Tax=Mycobacterium sp. 1164966.3 TaxID=1856861 RepID=UPI0007FE8EA8|nr:hypothetical protein [Mycobacterium sp. 1164966.3]OBA84061.1 hypothetical protein A9W99_06680 [Mycobacterium sp. 1164966.3]
MTFTAHLESPATEERVGRLGWEIAFKPVLMLLVMMYAIVCIPLGVMWFKEKRTIAGVMLLLSFP